MMTRLLTVLFFSAALFQLSGCETSNASRPTQSTANTRMVVPDNPVSSIAQREIVRRQERIRSADEAAIRAGQRRASGDLEGARAEYGKALDTLPE